jgi:hypothetical protein
VRLSRRMPHEIADAVVAPPAVHEPRVRRALRGILILIGVVLLVPAILVALFIGRVSLLPAYSAATNIPELRASVRLRFYYIWDVTSEQGRYLAIRAPTGSITIRMTAFDWAHNARTSLYLTPEHELAILGPIGDDHLVSVKPLKSTVPFRVQSENWTYLGAFDFTGYPGGSGDRELRFISASEQAECIPMRGGDTYDGAARNDARQRDCPRL